MKPRHLELHDIYGAKSPNSALPKGLKKISVKTTTDMCFEIA
jgi:hypothetical protein